MVIVFLAICKNFYAEEKQFGLLCVHQSRFLLEMTGGKQIILFQNCVNETVAGGRWAFK